MIKLIFTLLFALLAGITQAQSIDELNALNESIRSLERELKSIESQRRGTVAAISALQKKISAERQALEILAVQIESNTAKLQELQAEQSRITADRQLFEHQAQRAMLFLMENSGNLTAKSVFGGLDTANFAAVTELTAHLGNNLDQSIAKYLETSLKLTEIQQNLTDENAKMQTRLTERKRLTESWKASEGELARKLVLVKQDANAQKEYISMLELEAKNISDALRKADEASSPAPTGTFSALKGKLPWPGKGKVAEGFGSRMVAEAGIAVHSNGIKLALTDSAVLAVAAGNVVYADKAGAMQNLVIIRHDTQYYTVYGNLDAFEVKSGDNVSTGNEIGKINVDLASNSSYLYFEIRQNQTAINPRDWLKK